MQTCMHKTGRSLSSTHWAIKLCLWLEKKAMLLDKLSSSYSYTVKDNIMMNP